MWTCWTNPRALLPWTCNFEVKNFPFLETSITSHFLFLAISCLTSNSSMWMIDMLYEAYMDMNETSQTNSHLEIHKIRHSWPQLTMVDFLGFLVNWAMTDDFWTSNPWPKHSKRTPRSCEHVGPTLGPCLNGNALACLIDWSPDQFDLILLNDLYLGKGTMQCYAVDHVMLMN